MRISNMLSQCVFCFCNLDEQHYNSDICVHCLHEPLLSGAMENVTQFKQCTQCDQIICPFHALSYNLDADICVVCDQNFAYTPCNSSNEFMYDRNEDTLMDTESDRSSMSSSDRYEASDEESAMDSQNSLVDSRQHLLESEDDDDGGSRFAAAELRVNEPSRDRLNFDGATGGKTAVIVPVESNIILGEHTCCICLESFDVCKQVVSLKCHSTHIFHLDCISTWFSTNPICPFGCNKQIQKI